VFRLKRLLYHKRRQAAIAASLGFASLLCLALLAARVVCTGSTAHFHMVWNLFLAWLPMLGALVAYNASKRSGRGRWLLVLPFLGFWLLFFPNAPYILTDMIHLRPAPNVPLWYDLILLISFAWTGAFLGLVSLYLMQSMIRREAGNLVSWLFTLVVLGLAGFGVYLGRFPRWNSWDVLADPGGLLADIGLFLSNPLDHGRTVVFSVLFSASLAAMYFVMVALIHFRDDAPVLEPDRE
jgi:uncharacterized membrane protein